MIKLSKEQVFKLHAQLIEATGGSNGIRDISLASGEAGAEILLYITNKTRHTKESTKSHSHFQNSLPKI